MLKQTELKKISKQFKVSNKSTLRLEKVYLGFLHAGERKLLNSDIFSYDALEEDLQVLLVNNFKKVFSGTVDVKDFSPKLLPKTKDNKESLYNILTYIDDNSSKDFKKKCDEIAQLIISNVIYLDNVVLTCGQGTICVDNVVKNIMVATICKTTIGKVDFIYKGEDKKFALQSNLDSIINMSAPIDGFSYPIISDGISYKDNILYYSGKANDLNIELVSDVLGCEIELTAKQEHIYFNTILNTIFDGKLSAQKMYELYETFFSACINQEESKEDYMIDKAELTKAISKINVETKKTVEEGMKTVFSSLDYSFKSVNVLPNIEKKSLDLSNENSDIKIKPETLKEVKQIKKDGQLFLMIPIPDVTTTNGLSLITEEDI